MPKAPMPTGLGIQKVAVRWLISPDRKVWVARFPWIDPLEGEETAEAFDPVEAGEGEETAEDVEPFDAAEGVEIVFHCTPQGVSI